MKLTVPRPQGDLLVIGLSRSSIEHMLASGEPVRADFPQFGTVPIEVEVHAGESREALLQSMAKRGLVPPVL